MGFRTCRFLSLALLAGAALVGCNNTPDKPNKIANNGTGLPGNKAFVNDQKPNGNFPLAPGGGASPGFQPNSPLGSGPGNPLPPDKSFAPSGGINNGLSGIGNGPGKLPLIDPPVQSRNNGNIGLPYNQPNSDFGTIPSSGTGPALPPAPPVRPLDGKIGN